MSKARIIDAVKHLDLAATRQLLERDPKLLTVKNQQSRNLLHLACGASCEKLHLPETAAARMVTFLLDCGMAIEEDGLSGPDPCKPIWFAVALGRNRTVVKLLLKRGATPNGLFAAAWWDDTALLDILVRAGAEVDIVEEGGTPFVGAWRWRRFKAAKFLALRGADVNWRDARGKTPLHYGLDGEFDPRMLAWLVRHGASPDIEDAQGISPRAKAARKRDKRFLAALGGLSQ